MKDKIKIDIISDVMCPWCIIGYRNLEQAISELGIQDQIDIEWQPFELNPDMPKNGENLREHSARKYGSTPESSMKFRKEMTERGNEVGFTFDYFDSMRIVNTRAAHVLLSYAKELNLQTEMKFRLFTAFFSEQKDISDLSVLAKEAVAVGLDEKKVISLLNSDRAYQEVQELESDWHRLGISSVPTVVLNRSTAVSGAQPVGAFKQFIESALNKKN